MIQWSFLAQAHSKKTDLYCLQGQCDFKSSSATSVVCAIQNYEPSESKLAPQHLIWQPYASRTGNITLYEDKIHPVKTTEN